jgi:hypothetical protein
MTHRRSSVRAATWRVVAGCAGLFITAPAGCVSAQEVFLDLTRALQNVAERSAGKSERQPFPPTEPARFTENSPTHGTDFVLSGVVIAGDTRLALLEDASANPGGPQLLPVGGELAGYRLTDVKVDRVTLEGRGGGRMIVRLQAGGGAGGQTVRSAPVGRTDNPTPASDGSEGGEPDSIEAKEERQARRAERTAQEKTRALAERAASGQPSKLPPASQK